MASFVDPLQSAGLAPPDEDEDDEVFVYPGAAEDEPADGPAASTDPLSQPPTTSSTTTTTPAANEEEEFRYPASPTPPRTLTPELDPEPEEPAISTAPSSLPPEPEPDSEKRRAIQRAALEGDLDALKALLGEDSDDKFGAANEADARTGVTVLHAAAGRGHLRVAQYLVEECGAIVDMEDKEGETPLLRASHTPAHLPTLLYLLATLADARHTDNDGWTALHNAASAGSEDGVRALVQAGADIESLGGTGGGYTALMNAASKGHLSVLSYLLTDPPTPAYPFTRNRFGTTAYSLAASMLHLAACDLLARHESPLFPSPSTYNPLAAHQTVPVVVYENQRLDMRLKTLLGNGGKPRWSASGLGRDGRRAAWELRMPGSEGAGGEALRALGAQGRDDVGLPGLEDPFELVLGSKGEEGKAWFWLSDTWQPLPPSPFLDTPTDPDPEGWLYAPSFAAPPHAWRSARPAHLDALLAGKGVGGFKTAQMMSGQVSGAKGPATAKAGTTAAAKGKANGAQEEKYWVRRRRWVRVAQRRQDITLPFAEPERTMEMGSFCLSNGKVNGHSHEWDD